MTGEAPQFMSSDIAGGGGEGQAAAHSLGGGRRSRSQAAIRRLTSVPAIPSTSPSGHRAIAPLARST